MSILPLYASGKRAFSRFSLNLNGLWIPNYPGSPWTGTASAGNSGDGRRLQQNTSAPSTDAGSGLGDPDKTVAFFAGGVSGGDTDDMLLATSGGSGMLCSDLFTTTTHTGWALLQLYANSTNDNDTTPADNMQLWCTSGTNQAFTYFRNTGAGHKFGLYQFISPIAPHEVKVEADIAILTWQLVQWRSDGSTQSVRVNGGAWQSAATAAINSLNANLNLGRNTLATVFFYGRLAEIAFSPTYYNDTVMNDVLNDVRSYYSEALT